MISFAYTPSKDKAAYKEFFTLLPYVLPCKFCRANLIEHYESLPVDEALGSRAALTKWLYDIHNLVSDKLRSQGQTVPDPPPFSAVKEHYEERMAYGCSKTFFPGWEFLFSIVENHPKQDVVEPFPNAPPLEELKRADKDVQLRWNSLPGHCRFDAVCRFWKVLGFVLPFEEWRTLWKKSTHDCCRKTWQSKESSLKALWKTRKTMEDELELLNKTTFHDLCKMIRYYKSGCASSQNKQTRTCRRLRSSTRKR